MTADSAKKMRGEQTDKLNMSHVHAACHQEAPARSRLLPFSSTIAMYDLNGPPTPAPYISMRHPNQGIPT